MHFCIYLLYFLCNIPDGAHLCRSALNLAAHLGQAHGVLADVVMLSERVEVKRLRVPIGCSKRGYIRTTDQSDTGSAGIFSTPDTARLQSMIDQLVNVRHS
eukprot:1743341-Pyramimonas_sp.AAC.1